MHQFPVKCSLSHLSRCMATLRINVLNQDNQGNNGFSTGNTITGCISID